MKSYRVLGRSHANFIFRRGDEIKTAYNRDGVNGTVRLSTRYLECGFETPVPGDLQAIIDVDDAQNAKDAFTWVTVGRELASLVSICANAAMTPMEGELAYETTLGKKEREHFQRFHPADKGTFSSRTVPLDATVAFMSAVATHPERNRLLRAVTQYTLALEHWGMGNELLSVAHIFMGVEALKIAFLRKELETRGISKQELALEWGFTPDRGGTHDLFLDHQARNKLVFHGDELHHQLAKKVSDAFEHGTANGGALFKDARETLVPSASHLRRAIFEVAGVNEEHFAELERLGTPRGLRTFENYFISTLVGDGDELRFDGEQHPCWEWTYSMKAVSLDEKAWRFSFTPDMNMTARIREDFVFQGGQLEVWDGGHFAPPSAGDLKTKGDV